MSNYGVTGGSMLLPDKIDCNGYVGLLRFDEYFTCSCWNGCIWGQEAEMDLDHGSGHVCSGV